MTEGADRPAPADGRSARRERTRASIVGATIELIEAGDLTPTSREIAARAGVAEKTLFLHFADLDDLRSAVAAAHQARALARHRPVDPNLPFADRRRAFVRQRAALLEEMTPLRLTAVVAEVGSPALRASRARWTELSRAELAAVFAAELGRPPDRRRLAVLAVVTSWAAWDEWRVAQGLGRRAAAAAMADAVTLALGVDRTTG